jgi:acetoin utilization protein AcuB
LNNPGGIIVLEIAPRNYTLYEIARICENEDVIILNLQVHTNADSTLQVTLKLNRTALDAVVSSFERHNYHVTEVYGEEVRKEDIEEKYHLLMNYINM